jgi:uncharacterized protein (DUF58 family)
MRLYPTKTTAHLTVVALGMIAAGFIAKQPAIVGWAGAILVAVVLARAATLLSVSRIRAAGFEMLWSSSKRRVRGTKGGVVELDAEVRNRDTLAARFVKLRVLASPSLDVSVEPSSGEIAASGCLRFKVRVGMPRVGQHGIHGLSLEVHGAPGMFEVPLTFANPVGIEVLPRPLATYLLQPRGGRSRHTAAVGRSSRTRGEGDELRELRDHQAGDPFRRIAWKASARRGKLLVREFERQERELVYVVLDASVELWAGPFGRAPLDFAIDDAMAIAVRHLSRGDSVGLFVVGATPIALIRPDSGPAHVERLAGLLLSTTATYDASRSELDEADVAVRVLEHLRPLDSSGLADLGRGDLDALAARAEIALGRAPFSAAAPEASSPRERTLRRYLASFGLDSPPRFDVDPQATGDALAQALGHLAREKPRPSVVYVVAPAPSPSHGVRLGEVKRQLTRGGARLTWICPPLDAALDPPWIRESEVNDPGVRAAIGDSAAIAAAAVRVRARATDERARRALRAAGIKVARRS